MVTMKCKCGSSGMSFKNLTEKDFPNGLELDCCAKSEPRKPTEAEIDAVMQDPEIKAVIEAVQYVPEAPKAQEPKKSKKQRRQEKADEKA